MVFMRSSEMLALPMMRRLIENSAVMVRMPDRREGIFSLVCSRPLTRPAAMPHRMASTRPV